MALAVAVVTPIMEMAGVMELTAKKRRESCSCVLDTTDVPSVVNEVNDCWYSSYRRVSAVGQFNCKSCESK